VDRPRRRNHVLALPANLGTLEIFFLDRPVNGAGALNLDLPETDLLPAEENV
jgi:hypothetical protein